MAVFDDKMRTMLLAENSNLAPTKRSVQTLDLRHADIWTSAPGVTWGSFNLQA